MYIETCDSVNYFINFCFLSHKLLSFRFLQKLDTDTMVKAKKVHTPGSRPSGPSPGRPRKKARKGTERKLNYRSRYSQDKLERALHDVQNKKMSVREAAVHYKVPKSTLHDRHC